MFIIYIGPPGKSSAIKGTEYIIYKKKYSVKHFLCVKTPRTTALESLTLYTSLYTYTLAIELIFRMCYFCRSSIKYKYSPFLPSQKNLFDDLGNNKPPLGAKPLLSRVKLNLQLTV